jgi:membrane associated rhomboid family serine protease
VATYPDDVPAVRAPGTPVLWALVAVNAALFGLETLWGGSQSSFTLFRMGANLGRIGLFHEPWRILSSAFLHIGPVHLLLNMWALVAFGRNLERALGPRRFLVLYGACAAGGGLVSALTHEATLAAGASGAVWGLMVAEVVWLWRLQRAPGAPQVHWGVVLQPLVINLLYSFTPGIDIAGHLGGGLTGGILVWTGLFAARPEGPAWRAAAWICAAILSASVAVALARGRAWERRPEPDDLLGLSGGRRYDPRSRGGEAGRQDTPGEAARPPRLAGGGGRAAQPLARARGGDPSTR